MAGEAEVAGEGPTDGAHRGWGARCLWAGCGLAGSSPDEWSPQSLQAL